MEESISSPSFNGITINTYNEYYDSGSSTIASCGVYNFWIFNGGSNHQFVTGDFNLNINTYYNSFYSTQDWINVLTHELGHALGIGTFWQSFFSTWGSEPPVSNFLNASAYNALSASYGTIIGGGRPRIALESSGGAGTNSAHWENNYRDSSAANSYGFNYPGLVNELMVGFYSQFINFVISSISIKHLTDYGYEEVTPGASEGIPSLDIPPGFNIETSAPLTSGIGMVKYNCGCGHDVEGSILGLFDENNENIGVGVVVDAP